MAFDKENFPQRCKDAKGQRSKKPKSQEAKKAGHVGKVNFAF